MSAILEARDLKRHYQISRGAFREAATLKAVDGASKSTLARMIAMIELPTSGSFRISDKQVDGASAETLRILRPTVQMVFQNPYGSLNPRQKVGAILEEPLLVNTQDTASQRTEKARAMMTSVGLRPEHYDRYPHMFSGGQRQRIAIARALMLSPEILVLDEPVSALDISIQAQVLNLLAELQKKMNLAYVFISHDLSVVRHIADDVMVMYLGRVVEQGPSEALFSMPRHPYTQALLSATPIADPMRKRNRIILKGELPSPLNPPSGCTFNPRCPLAFERCRIENPALLVHGKLHAACHAVKD
jgi:dipeptide transport system ATP-binding protein